MTRILVVDDHEIVRRGLKDILTDEFPKLQVGEAGDARDAIEAVRQQAWDVALLDINMPGRSGLEVLEELKVMRPKMPVVMLSSFPEEHFAVRSFKLGASAYVTKRCDPEELLAAIHKSIAGGRYVTPSLGEKLAASMAGEAPAVPHECRFFIPAVGAVVVPQDSEPPDYERFGPPFGEGGFGKVWVARNAIGQWQALKEVYKANFGDDAGKFEMEFNGIQKYKPISHAHPGLLRIEFVSREKRDGRFYYVMELGDALDPDRGWEQDPTLYKPRDLKNVCARAEQKRLPIQECIEIGIRLADALDFLHREGLTHRDIKPANVIFVNGKPKLADAGTVTLLRPPEQINTRVVSRGYTPPDEPPGTRQADIYSLGKLLYVIGTGRNAEDDFPTLSMTLPEKGGQMDFMGLNKVILKACQPDLTERYASAMEMQRDLLAVVNAPAVPHESLSIREMQVLRLIAQGRTIKEIAAELSLSEKTIATYRTRISEKLGLSTNVDLTRHALQNKLCN